MREALYDDGTRRIVPDWVKPHHNTVWRIYDPDKPGEWLAMGSNEFRSTFQAKVRANEHKLKTEGWFGKPVKMIIGQIYY